MSVYRNIAFALENMRLPQAEIEARVARAAGMLRLTDYLDRKPGALSGGQRQRVAIGRAVVRDPKIFLFDEPLSNLDAELRVATRKELAALHAELGGTMIYVTHDQVEAMTLADRIVVLHGGKIEQVGSPLELYNRPANQFVAGFIGSPRMNFLAGKVGPGRKLEMTANHAELVNVQAPDLPPGAAVTIGIRPEHVEFAAPEASDCIAEVEIVEQLGGDSFIYGKLDDGAPLTLRCANESPAKRGDRIPVRFQRERVHLFSADGAAIAG